MIINKSIYHQRISNKFNLTLIQKPLSVLISIGYILQAPEGLRIPSMIVNVIAIIATLISALFLKKFKKNDNLKCRKG